MSYSYDIGIFSLQSANLAADERIASRLRADGYRVGVFKVPDKLRNIEDETELYKKAKMQCEYIVCLWTNGFEVNMSAMEVLQIGAGRYAEGGYCSLIVIEMDKVSWDKVCNAEWISGKEYGAGEIAVRVDRYIQKNRMHVKPHLEHQKKEEGRINVVIASTISHSDIF